MMQQSPLHIIIPDPCNESWDTMRLEGNGKYCTRCKNIVYDLSGMNDNELFEFLRKSPAVHCGRFHNSQLNRSIPPPQRKHIFSFEKFSRIAATVFTILSFKAVNLKAENRHLKPSLVVDSKFKKLDLAMGTRFNISGVVKDVSGIPLENVSVMFDSRQAAVTGSDGKFSFEIDNMQSDNHVLYFSLDGFITAVRNYHFTMQSTDYDIVLSRKGSGGQFHTAGIMINSFSAICAEKEIAFTSNDHHLTIEGKAVIKDISAKLKAYPFGSVDIKTSFVSAGKSHSLAKKRAEAVKKYMTDRDGISPERIFIKIQKSGTNTNNILIVEHSD
jgi:Carboxypeptidase regulatory-like domain